MGLCPLFVFGGTVDRLARVRAIAERVAGAEGLEIFDVQFRREQPGWVLRVVIDRPWTDGAEAVPGRPEEAIGVAECQRISEDLSALLDVEDVIDRAYTLEVSSPGLDRPLRSPADYRRFCGRLAKIVVAEPIDEQTFFEGRIDGVDGDAVLVAIGRKGRVARIPFAAITRARLGVEWQGRPS